MTLSPIKIEGSRWLQRISLRALLYAGFGALATAALVSLAGALAMERLTQTALARYRAIDAPVTDLISRANDAFLQARRYEKDYFLSLRTLGIAEARGRYVTLWRTGVEDVLTNLAKAAELAGEARGELAARATRNAALLKQYESGFDASVGLTSTLGSLNVGLEGEMRRAAEALESQLAGAGAELNGLLQLRRHEKDFLLRGRAQYAAAFAEASDAQLTRLRVWRARPSQREAALSHLGRYVALFERYVQVSGELEERRREYLAAAQRLEPDLAAMQYDSLTAASEAIVRLDSEIARSVRGGVAIDILMLLVALVAAFLITRVITGSTQRIVSFADSLASGELAARLPPVLGRELRALGESLNRMADTVQEKNAARDRLDAEILQLNAELENRVAERTSELERANAQLTAHSREISLANELTSVLQSVLGLEEAATLVSRYLERLLPGTSGALYVLKSSGHYLELIGPWGAWQPAGSMLALEDCWALRRGRVYALDDAAEGLACAHTDPATPAYICIPLSAQASMLGLLHVRFPSAIDAGHLRALSEQLAQQISLALANVKLRDRLREQSIRDPLTGLYNRRYLEETLERELARARRESKPVAVFMLDVDHFKKFNDAHGHEAGDEVLRALGRTLRANCRTEDVACRYGGEEFTVVLPAAPQQAAGGWAERLMQRVRSMELRAGNQPIRITVSLGLAMFPEHGDNGDALLQAADRALYAAKTAGRDRMAAALSA